LQEANVMTIDHPSLFIGGQWVPPSSRRRVEVRSASTEQTIGSVPEAAEADVDKAVDAARRAFDDPQGWAQWPAEQRAKVLERLADEWEKRSEEILYAISQQNGMPIAIARQLEGTYPPALLRYYAGLIRIQPVDEVRQGLVRPEYPRASRTRRRGRGDRAVERAADAGDDQTCSSTRRGLHHRRQTFD
jgi:aldehyde dehydrogenase (NAD+)